MEPFGMLFDPRVIGRALDREVEADLEAYLLRLVDESIEVVDRAEVRVDRFVPACFGTDRPRDPDVVWLGYERVVLAFTEVLSDRVDRWQVDDIEAHRGDPLE